MKKNLRKIRDFAKILELETHKELLRITEIGQVSYPQLFAPTFLCFV